MSILIEFPSADDEWASADLVGEGWQIERIEAALELAQRNASTALLLLHRGRIVCEGYWRIEPAELPPEAAAQFTRFSLAPDRFGRPVEDVGSVQNSMTAVLLAIARERGVVDFNHPVQEYLGQGWSQASLDQEREIAIWHLMSMTSGLDARLRYRAPAGLEWHYNTRAYQQLIRVMTRASGLDPDALTRTWLGDRIGMHSSRWMPRHWSGAEASVGLVSTALDLGRLALLVQNRGKWMDEEVVSADALDELLNESQTMNPAYGLLWWLNGKEAYVPASGGGRAVGPLITSAPSDLVVGLGTMDRQLAVSWGEEMSLVRLGAPCADGPRLYRELWAHIMAARPESQV